MVISPKFSFLSGGTVLRDTLVPFVIQISTNAPPTPAAMVELVPTAWEALLVTVLRDTLEPFVI